MPIMNCKSCKDIKGNSFIKKKVKRTTFINFNLESLSVMPNESNQKNRVTNITIKKE